MTSFILTFFLGAAVGSFVNVLIDRTVAGHDWIKGRSHCDYCQKTLEWYDLLPIISFVVYRGKSRCCHRPLPYRYPLVEALTGLLFVWWMTIGFWFFRLSTAPLSTIQPTFWLLTGVIVLVLALADWTYGVVLLPIVYLGYASAIAYRLILTYAGIFQSTDLVATFVTSLLAYLFFWGLYKLTRGRGMAEGDMYVAAYVGLVLGWPRGVMALALSFVLGAIIGVGLILLGKKTRKDTLPFVPFMMAAMVMVLFWGEQISRFLG